MPRDGDVAVEANRYPVPLGWAGRRVEVRIRAEEIELGGDGLEPVRYRRLTGKHQVARWSGPPRQPVRPPGVVFDGPPRLDPAFLGPAAEVPVRSLADYAAAAEVSQ